ncbi:hypothetical protein F511_45651 [Dorcoceras hygrometricum]|uniref:Uncharacterized protein n=1 Tax=Dorcoceras hygrometricum TaxID=472368 RepID=A0A2Z6ZVH3_9LAMI|nr:hypothetical protein F511_45651 [Dorcoceras hygrometricum]
MGARGSCWPHCCTLDGRRDAHWLRNITAARRAMAGRRCALLVPPTCDDGRCWPHAGRAEGGRSAHSMAGRRCLEAPLGRALLVVNARRSRDVVRVPPRIFFRGGAAAVRPPLRRCRDGWSEFF